MADPYHLVVTLVRYRVVGDDESAKDAFVRAEGLAYADVLKAAAGISAMRFEQAGKVLGCSAEDLYETAWRFITAQTTDPEKLDAWQRAIRMARAFMERDTSMVAELINDDDLHPATQLWVFTEVLVVLQNSLAKSMGVDSFAAELWLTPDAAFEALEHSRGQVPPQL